MKRANEYIEELLDFSTKLIADNQNDNYELIKRVASGDYMANKDRFEDDVNELELRTDLSGRILKTVGEYIDERVKK